MKLANITILLFLAIGWLSTALVLQHKVRKLELLHTKKPRKESSEKERQVMEKINLHVIEQKGYLQPGLTLGTLANALGVNSGYISRAVNRNTNQHFCRWLNGIRITHAIVSLSDPARTCNFSEIAYDVGFNDRTTFFRAFKQHTGTSPRDFCRSAEEKRCDSRIATTVQ